MGIDPPMGAADIDGVREKVKDKLEFWRADQEAETARVSSLLKIDITQSDSRIRTLPRPRKNLNVLKLKIPHLLHPSRLRTDMVMAKPKRLLQSTKVDRSLTKSL